jgi:integrase
MLADISAESFLAWLETKSAEEDLSEQTRNHYRAAKSFSGWLVKSRKLAPAPLASVPGQTKVIKLTYVRRALTRQEFDALLETTLKRKKSYCRLDALASGTGFRVGALAGLRPIDFVLSGDAPSVTVAPDDDKAKKGRTHPLPPSVVPILSEFVAGKEATAVLWPGSWRENAGKMIRADAVQAGIDIGELGKKAAQRKKGNPIFDFHCLRHSFGTLLCRSGVNLRVAQELMGHSSPDLTAR